MLLLDAGRLLVKLGLDGNPFAVVLAARNKVNACVGLPAVIAPPIPALDLVELRRKHRVSFEEVDHQLLKGDSVLALGLVFTELIEDFAERRHVHHFAVQVVVGGVKGMPN